MRQWRVAARPAVVLGAVAGLTLGLTGPAGAAADTSHAAAAGTIGSAASSPRASGSPGSGADLTKLVNPFIGTKNEGLDFPAVGAPFGMVQEAPMVKNRPGAGGNECDSNSAAKIYGFSQTTINGCRFNYVPVMPTTGPITSTNPTGYASSFHRATEHVHPDEYQVRLDRYGIGASLTAGTRTGWQRYTFPPTSKANVLFNTGAGVSNSEIHIVGKRTVTGRVNGRPDAYFVARFSRPFTTYGTWKNSKLNAGSRNSANSGSNGGWVSFDTRKNDAPVVVKVGLSYTGPAGARKNLHAETKALGFNYEAAHTRLHRRWNKLLHRAEISGGSHDQRVAFYTALYHSVLDPNVVGDVDGRYRGPDNKTHKAHGFTPYSNFSLWDTYRTQNQLVELLAPQVAHDVDMSLLAIAHQGGWLPRWYLGNKDDNIMTGDPVTPFLVDGWAKGLYSHKEAERVYNRLRQNATQVPPASAPENGRAAAEYYNQRGYIPYGLHVSSREDCPEGEPGTACCPTHGADNDCYYPASAQLEYATADASMALMAKGLGHPRDAKLFAERGQSYRNIFDRNVGTFRPRTMDGTWLKPFNDKTGDHAFHEAGPRQYQWMVPQDPSGLIQLLGGRAATTQQLDRFFAYPSLLRHPARTARNTWVSDPYGYYGFTKYQPDNEPDLLAPYLYSWTGRPDKTATVVRAAETLYTNSPTGMTGNDDMGEMSAWYVMSALGLYPTMPGSNFYVVTTPLFPHARVQIGSYGKTQGGTLNISAPGPSMHNRYIASARVNGKSWHRSWVRQADIAHGGTIDYTLSTSPTRWATSRQAAPPSVNRAPRRARKLSGNLTPDAAAVTASATGPSRQRLTLTLLATTPGNAQMHVATTAPPGWSVSADGGSKKNVASHGLPTQVKVPLTVTAPADTKPGTYTVSVTVHMAGTAPVHKTANISARPPGSCATRTSTACAVDLSGYYNRDGAATLTHPSQGNLDGHGSSYAANLLPKPGPTTLGGVTYQAPPTTGTEPNFVTADGQTLTLPKGRYGKLSILGAATNGATGVQGGAAVVTYSDGSTASVPIKFSKWIGDKTEFGNHTAIKMPYLITAHGKDSKPVSLYHTTITLNPNKTVRTLTLPHPSVPEWVAPGLTGTAWDHNSDLQVYAMTLQR